MVKFKPFVAALLAIAISGAPAEARRGRTGDQEDILRDTQTGVVRPLRSIENGLVPGMKERGADYIGAEYDGDSARYRLKFMRGRSVIWIDVDGKSGNVVGRAGE